MALAERHAPARIARRMARLGAGAVPAATVTLVVDVLDLDDLQHVAPRLGFAQIEHQVGLTRTARPPAAASTPPQRAQCDGMMITSWSIGRRCVRPWPGAPGCRPGRRRGDGSSPAPGFVCAGAGGGDASVSARLIRRLTLRRSRRLSSAASGSGLLRPPRALARHPQPDRLAVLGIVVLAARAPMARDCSAAASCCADSAPDARAQASGPPAASATTPAAARA